MKKFFTFSILFCSIIPQLSAQNGFYNQLRTNPSETSFYSSFTIVDSRYYLEITALNISILHNDPFNDGVSFSVFSTSGGIGMLGVLAMAISDASRYYLPTATMIAISPILLSNSSFHYNFIHIESDNERNTTILGLKFTNRTDYFMGQRDHFWRYSPSLAVEYDYVETSKSGNNVYDEWGFGINAGIEKPIDLNNGDFFWRQIAPFVGIYYISGYY